MKSTPVDTAPDSLALSDRLGDITRWAQRLLAEVIKPGARLVDLTAGNGHDSLFLERLRSVDGQLLCFDVQQAALDATTARLQEHGFAPTRVAAAASIRGPGCYLINDGHQNLSPYLSGEVQAAIANLGYLPGGDKQLTTQPSTTLSALQILLPRLSVGGRLALVIYPGHPVGAREGAAVDAACSALSAREFDVLRLQVCNHHNAPYLMLVERRCN